MLLRCSSLETARVDASQERHPRVDAAPPCPQYPLDPRASCTVYHLLGVLARLVNSVAPIVDAGAGSHSVSGGITHCSTRVQVLSAPASRDAATFGASRRSCRRSSRHRETAVVILFMAAGRHRPSARPWRCSSAGSCFRPFHQLVDALMMVFEANKARSGQSRHQGESRRALARADPHPGKPFSDHLPAFSAGLMAAGLAGMPTYIEEAGGLWRYVLLGFGADGPYANPAPSGELARCRKDTTRPLLFLSVSLCASLSAGNRPSNRPKPESCSALRGRMRHG